MYLFVFRSKSNYPYIEIVANDLVEAKLLLVKIGYEDKDFYVVNVINISYQTRITCPLKHEECVEVKSE